MGTGQESEAQSLSLPHHQILHSATFSYNVLSTVLCLGVLSRVVRLESFKEYIPELNVKRNVPTCLFSAGDCSALKSVSRPDW